MSEYGERTKRDDIELHIWTEKESLAHSHEHYEFVICNNGEIYHKLNDEPEIKLTKKVACLITPFDRHAIIHANNATHVNIAFTPRMFRMLTNYFDLPSQDEAFLKGNIELTDEEFANIMAKTERAMQIAYDSENHSLYIVTVKQLIVELFYIFLKHQYRVESVPLWLREFISKVCCVEYFATPIKDLYKLSNYSQPIVTNAFKKYYGKTFVQYFTEVKIFYACGLLKNTNFSILDISDKVGFSSLSHFNLLFKKMTGMSPGSFRKRGVSR